MKSVAIIGAGISGLAAAFDLTRRVQDIQTTVFEASSRVGGVLETEFADGNLIERSADNFATLIPDALQLCKDSGFTEHLVQPESENRQAFVLNRGRLLPLPAGFSLMQPTRVWSILTTPTLSLQGKARLLGEFFVSRRQEESDESLESFATRRLGREAYETLVEPIVSGIFTANPATLSMQATMPQFVDMERRHGGLIRGHLANRKQNAAAVARKASGARYDQFMAPKQGMTSWIEHLANTLPSDCLKLSTPVQRLVLDRDSMSWSVETNAESLRFDAVVLATPAAVTASLLRQPLPEVADIVDNIPYASSAVVAVIVNKSELRGRIDGFGLISPRKEGRPTLAISYSSNKYEGRVPNEQILLRIFLGGALNPGLVDESDAELTRVAFEELRQILGWTGERPMWSAVIRWKNAMPQYLIGHVQRMSELDNLLEKTPTLKLCGAAYRGVGIPQCVRSGRAAAAGLTSLFSCEAATAKA